MLRASHFAPHKVGPKVNFGPWLLELHLNQAV